MQVADHDHPDQGLIIAALPKLVNMLAARLDFMGQRRLSNDELLSLAHRSMECWGPFQFWQAGPCLVGLNIVQPWWSPDPVLAEEFIVRYKPGNFADTIAELEAHAKAQGCKALVISSLAQIRKESYGHYLQRKGFREVSREYVKGI